MKLITLKGENSRHSFGTSLNEALKTGIYGGDSRGLIRNLILYMSRRALDNIAHTVSIGAFPHAWTIWQGINSCLQWHPQIFGKLVVLRRKTLTMFRRLTYMSRCHHSKPKATFRFKSNFSKSIK